MPFGRGAAVITQSIMEAICTALDGGGRSQWTTYSTCMLTSIDHIVFFYFFTHFLNPSSLIFNLFAFICFFFSLFIPFFFLEIKAILKRKMRRGTYSARATDKGRFFAGRPPAVCTPKGPSFINTSELPITIVDHGVAVDWHISSVTKLRDISHGH